MPVRCCEPLLAGASTAQVIRFGNAGPMEKPERDAPYGAGAEL
jgi:hypothetical protein